MRFTPSAPQIPMIDHQLSLDRQAVWAGMGLGKTGGTLTSLARLELVEPGPALVIAPLRVAKTTWPDEIAKWDNLSAAHECSPIVGNPAERLAALARDASVYTINDENLPWLAEQFKGRKRWPFVKVVRDEATRFKSFRVQQGAKRSKAIAPFVHTHVKWWTNLTGTPAPNGLKDLWGQTWFLDAGQRLGRTFGAFEERWFRHVRAGDYWAIEPMPFSQEQIEDRLRDICLSLNPKDYFDLADPIERVVKVDLPSVARGHYREMEKAMFTEIGGFNVEAVNAASKTQKCLQLASGAIWIDTEERHWREVHDAKLQALESIVEEAAGMPVLVATWWKHDMPRILKAFPKARVLDTDPQTIRDWNAGKIPMLLAHPQSAGHGLNLQDGGNIVVFFSQWWDLELHDQILERIGPMRQLQSGHDRPVYVYYIVAHNTLDELVMVRRVSKRSVQSLLMEAMKLRSTGSWVELSQTPTTQTLTSSVIKRLVA